MIETIDYKFILYPEFQTQGFAAQFAFPYAKHVCKGKGVDIGCSKKEWAFPGALIVDPVINKYTATDFPYCDLDYVFSSHCLEHLDNWVEALDYWTESLKEGGTLFLYLPDYSQEYWRPWNNRKHINVMIPQIIRSYMLNNGYHNIFTSGVDLNNSFMIMGEKKT
jgi:SAM-dependent methyltransferase